MTEYNNDNRVRLFHSDKGPVDLNGFFNVDGTDYRCSLLKLGGSGWAKAYLLLETDDHQPIGGGFLKPSQYGDSGALLYGTVAIKSASYGVTLYKGSSGKLFASGPVKAMSGSKKTSTKAKAQTEDEPTDNDW